MKGEMVLLEKIKKNHNSMKHYVEAKQRYFFFFNIFDFLWLPFRVGAKHRKSKKMQVMLIENIANQQNSLAEN